jgi:hypothetical protein
MYPLLPVSLDCPFEIAPSVFSGVYLVHTNRFWKNRHAYSKSKFWKVKEFINLWELENEIA